MRHRRLVAAPGCGFGGGGAGRLLGVGAARHAGAITADGAEGGARIRPCRPSPARDVPAPTVRQRVRSACRNGDTVIGDHERALEPLSPLEAFSLVRWRRMRWPWWTMRLPHWRRLRRCLSTRCSGTLKEENCDAEGLVDVVAIGVVSLGDVAAAQKPPVPRQAPPEDAAPTTTGGSAAAASGGADA